MTDVIDKSTTNLERLIEGRDIANMIGVSNKSLVEMVTRHEVEIEKRETIPTKGRPKGFHYFTIPNAALIIACSRASASVKNEALKALKSESLYELIMNFDVDPEIDVKFIYIAKDESDRFKIGISNDPNRRIRELNVGNAEKIKLVAVAKANNRFEDEAMLHHANADKRIKGEWFRSIDIQETIGRLN
jgi:predicted GIY-YIG superfamily endonuclease